MTGTVSAALELEAATATERFVIPLPTTPVPMRRRCPHCGHPDGILARKQSQCVVSCAACAHFAYNAPRKEQIRLWGRT